MKKCKGCKYFSEPNENHKECLCLFFCMGVVPNGECISEKVYIENQEKTYKKLTDIDEMYNLIRKIESDNFIKKYFSYGNDDINEIVWKYGNDKDICKQKIYEYIGYLRDEIFNYYKENLKRQMSY